MLREDNYTDSVGRKFRVLVPENETDLSRGIIVGPPFLDSLKLPRDLEVRLNNELFNRKLFTQRDVMRRLNEVSAALQAALRTDVQNVVNLYGVDNAKYASN